MMLRLQWPLAQAVLVIVLGLTACQSTLKSDCQVSVNHGWKACWAINCSILWNVTLPTTALVVLLDHGAIEGLDFTSEQLYDSMHLAQIPDIYQTRRDYYTLRYQLDQVPLIPSSCKVLPATRRTLRIASVHYSLVSPRVNGQWVEEIGSDAGVDGLFRRRHLPLELDSTNVSLIIAPPRHPGQPRLGRQGGDHDLARDGPTAQYLLGWDWAAAMPDRSTGWYGQVVVDTTGPAAFIDPAVQTVALKCDFGTCHEILLRLLVRIECVNCRQRSGTLQIESAWGDVWTTHLVLEDDMELNVQAEVRVAHPEQVVLWWPHDIGMEPVAALSGFTFTIAVDGVVSDRQHLRAGIRTVETYLDPTTQGQVFLINSHKIFLVGGNWIGTDQAWRYSADKQRYCDELRLHQDAGFNLIRVWGGGTAERDDFYDCADELGLLVMQEFWMTGDNNGRWAGNYSWPDDWDTYLVNIGDTVRRLRRHASLLFYGGCNECAAPTDSRWGPNPVEYIDLGIRVALERFDPGRFYISSSMSGKNKADRYQDPVVWFNRSFALAFADGPYSMQYASTFFERNPGLGLPNVSIGFQPEVGSASSPSYRGLLRFMSRDEVDQGFPSANGTVGEAWAFHKFMDYRTESYDHVYAYFPNGPRTASDWAAGAMLATHQQYQHLLNGYLSFIFEYYTAIIIWKTQSPWPALRGFLYDWYLETTGMGRGARAAIGRPVSVILDMKLFQLRLVNRSILPFVHANGKVGVAYRWITLEGETVGKGLVEGQHAILPAMSGILLGNTPLKWPRACRDVCFLHLRALPESGALANKDGTWYWLTNPTSDKADFSYLGKARARQKGQILLHIDSCMDKGSSLVVDVTLTIPKDAVEGVFYPTFSISLNDTALLPLLDNSTRVLLLPGESETRRLTASCSPDQQRAQLALVVDTWNAGETTYRFACSANVVS